MSSESWVRRQGVVVHDAVDRVVRLLHRDVVAEGAQVVADVRQPGRLDAAEDALARCPGAAVEAAVADSGLMAGESSSARRTVGCVHRSASVPCLRGRLRVEPT